MLIFNRTIRQVDIVNPVKQTKNKRYSNSGTLRILHCHVDKQFSLIDYVRGNCVIRMVCALDFTMSNGTPLTKGSLHTSDEEKVSCTRYFDSNTKLKVTMLLPCLTTWTGSMPYIQRHFVDRKRIDFSLYHWSRLPTTSKWRGWK